MFSNKEVKNYTIKYILFFLLFAAVLFLLLHISVEKMEEQYYRELVSLNTDHDSLSEQGKLSYLPSDYSHSIKSSIKALYLSVYSAFFLLALCGYFLGLKLYKVPLNAIHKIKTNSEGVLEGDYNNISITDIPDGDISQLYSMYTKMVSAIRQSKEKEKQERVFLQDLIADISHQLKTPLATLTIYQDLLSNPNITNEKRKEMLKLMGDQLSRMEWLILSLLKLARLESGAIEFTIKKQPLLPTLQLASQNVKMLSDAKKQKISLECDNVIILAHDQDWLSEAITNILKNATEYAPENSTIEVTVSQSPVTTTIHIKDYGKGIEKSVQTKVFKRFYRAKADVNTNSIGIGLSLSKSIVEGQKGDITVESQVGKFTCFTITFYHSLI